MAKHFALLLALIMMTLAPLGTGSRALAAAGGWQFNEDGNTEGWTFNDGIVDPVVANGSLSFRVQGNDPWILSPTTNIPTSENNIVVVRMKNSTSNASGRIYFATDSHPNLSQDKSAGFELIPNDSGYTEYRVDMRYNPLWQGTITRLRLDPADNPTASGPMSVDSITFDYNSQPPTSRCEYKPAQHSYIGHVSDVSVNASRITVRGSVNDASNPEGRDVELYELATYQRVEDYASLDPVAVKQGPFDTPSFTFTIDRYDGQRDRYYSKFLVVARDPSNPDSEPLFVDRPQYASDIEFAAENEYPYPKALSKKGIQVQMVDDAEELGISHAAINVVLGSLMFKDDPNSDNAIEYKVDGSTFYFNKNAVESLDHRIKSLSDNGITVNLILILYNDTNPNSAFGYLVHPDADVGQGIVYAFNTANAQGVTYFKAAMEFLTDRYTREDQKYGRAVGYIVGNEVDAQWVWQNMGLKDVDEFVENYAHTVRIVYQAARKHYNHPRVYVSLDHSWTVASGTDPCKYYKGRDIVDKMNELSKQHGDFPWHIAYHPYPENLFDPAFWKDKDATDSFDTPLITFKNIQVLPRYMEQPELEYQGNPRRIILSEQGCNTADYSVQAQKLQAACYAYAYYKIRFLDGIDSFILHRHVDHQLEGGLRLGLWTWDKARPEPSAPGEKKFIYHVFQQIDTRNSLAVSQFAKPIIGIDDWKDVIPSFDSSKLAQRTPPQLVGAQFVQKPLNAKLISGFESGTNGWTPAENAGSVERNTADSLAGTASLQVNFNSEAKLWRGADLKLDSPIDASASPYLSLAIKLPDYEPGDSYYAKIKVYGDPYSESEVGEGVVRLDPARGWNMAALDLSGWEGISSIHRIKVWVRSDTDKNWSGRLLVDSVSLPDQLVPDEGRHNTNIGIDSTTAGMGEGSEITLKVTNYDEHTLNGYVYVDPAPGVTLSDTKLDVEGMRPGDIRVFTLKVTGYDPPESSDPTRVTYRYLGRTLTAHVRVVMLYPPWDTVYIYPPWQPIG